MLPCDKAVYYLIPWNVMAARTRGVEKCEFLEAEERRPDRGNAARVPEKPAGRSASENANKHENEENGKGITLEKNTVVFQMCSLTLSSEKAPSRPKATNENQPGRGCYFSPRPKLQVQKPGRPHGQAVPQPARPLSPSEFKRRPEPSPRRGDAARGTPVCRPARGPRQLPTPRPRASGVQHSPINVCR